MTTGWPARLAELFDRWHDRHVIVVGDALLDGWLDGEPSRLCREAPVPVVAVNGQDLACGGAGNTAANLAALGARVTLVSAVGDDEPGAALAARAEAAGVVPHLVTVPGRATVVKRRLVADGQIIVRFDDGDRGPAPPERRAELLARLADALAEGADALVVCDYDAGLLDQHVRGWLAGRRATLPLLVLDAHDLRGWAGLTPDLITPNFAEARRLVEAERPEPDPPAALRADWAVAHGDAVRAALQARMAAITLDVGGAVVVADGEVCRTYAKPAPSRQAIGAGDSYVAAFTLALLGGASPAEAATVAQQAATAAIAAPGGSGMAVRTALCRLDDLREQARGPSPAQQAERESVAAAPDGPFEACGLVEAAQLAPRLSNARRAGQRVVFTNGCFDVLHRGHVGYLQQARRLGDLLVVALNSDASVRRLKGPERPVNPVEDRAAVLAALAAVDYVVVFDEDSPERLIELIQPEMYVKGGDYPPEMIPEAPLVRRLGGEVRVLDYLPDRSTSELIARMRSGAARSAR